MNKISFFVTLILLSFRAIGADVVPYSVKYIKPFGAGFIELVGPGKMLVNGENIEYEGKKYISTKNIDSMTGVSVLTKGCTLHYSSEGYTENISVIAQSCSEIISIINVVNK